jgi:hypothetical protein
MADNKVRITLTADGSDAEEAFRGLNRQLGKTQKEAGQTERSFIDLNAAVSKGASALKTGGIVVGTMATGMAYLSKQVLESVVAMQQQADIAGVSTTTFQELDYAASKYKITQEALQDGLKEMQLRTEEFVKTGAGPGKEALERLGYSQDELNKKLKDAPGLLTDMVGRMQDLDKAAQMRLADEIFGGQGGEQFVAMIDAGADSLGRFRDEAHELGLVLNREMVAQAQEANRTLDLTSRILKTDLQRAIIAISPTIETMAEFLGDAAVAAANFIDSVVPMSMASLDQLDQRIEGIRDTIDELREEGGKTTGKGSILGQTTQDDLQIQRLQEELKELRDQREETQARLEAYSKALESNTEFTGDNAQANKENAKSLEELKGNWLDMEQVAQRELENSFEKWDAHTRTTKAQAEAMQEYYVEQLRERNKETEEANKGLENETEESMGEIEQIVHQAFHERMFNDLTDGLRDLLDDWKFSWSGLGDWLEDWAKDTVAAVMGQFLQMKATPVMLPTRTSVPGGSR